MKSLPLVSMLVVAAVLSGCQQEARQAKATGGTAAGEVLPGSASDAMIPVDTLRSQPPAAPKTEGTDKAKAKDKPSAGAPAAAPAEEVAAPDPAPAEE